MQVLNIIRTVVADTAPGLPNARGAALANRLHREYANLRDIQRPYLTTPRGPTPAAPTPSPTLADLYNTASALVANPDSWTPGQRRIANITIDTYRRTVMSHCPPNLIDPIIVLHADQHPDHGFLGVTTATAGTA